MDGRSRALGINGGPGEPWAIVWPMGEVGEVVKVGSRNTDMGWSLQWCLHSSCQIYRLPTVVILVPITIAANPDVRLG